MWRSILEALRLLDRQLTEGTYRHGLAWIKEGNDEPKERKEPSDPMR